MNAVMDLQTAQDQLTADYQRRLSLLQQAEAAAAAAIAEAVELEAATAEKAARAHQKAQALQSLETDMEQPTAHAKRIVALADGARKEIAEAHATIRRNRDLLTSLYTEAAIVCGETANAVKDNLAAFDDKIEAQRFVVSKLYNLLPLGMTGVGDSLPFATAQTYRFSTSFGDSDRQRLISNVLVLLR